MELTDSRDKFEMRRRKLLLSAEKRMQKILNYNKGWLFMSDNESF